MTEASLDVREMVGVEDPGWLLPDVEERWKDEAERA